MHVIILRHLRRLKKNIKKSIDHEEEDIKEKYKPSIGILTKISNFTCCIMDAVEIGIIPVSHRWLVPLPRLYLGGGTSLSLKYGKSA